MSIGKLLRELHMHWAGREGIGALQDVEAAEKAMKVTLPADFKFFVMDTDGGDTLPPLPRIRFYPLSEVVDLHSDSEMEGVIEIATNDSDAFAFDVSRNRDNAKYRVVRYPVGAFDRSEIEPVARDFEEFVAGILGGQVS